MPKLLLKFNAAVIKEVVMEKESISIGRKPDNDIVIDNPAISGHHCKLTMEGGGYYVEDLESTNGTFVNEKRIKKSGLHHNDVVGVAKHAVVFLNEAELAAEAANQPSSDATMVLAPQKQAELLAASSAAAKPAAAEKAGWLRIIKGVVDVGEHELKGMSTYIGKSDRVQVQIKGSGLFGSAPEVAASVHRKPEG
ncbi:MAG: FHA domain-containing protein, partial [Elusimicrobia bacterium]|nr:FHA domain-containing protein [Elusimicrobiota bacterium]